MKIGIFDSGIGGLTVLKEIIKKYPNQEYIYFGDNKNIPYGSKSKEDLKKLVDSIMQFLMEQEVDMIIIACGTVSSTLYSYLKENYNVPIYDIISPMIEFMNHSNYEQIGIIATPVTIQSKVLENQIKKTTVSRDCPLFVPLIESGKMDSIEMEEAVEEYMSSFANIDALILGCTHYPLLISKIQKILPNTDLINMGAILASTLPIMSKHNLKVSLYFSKVDEILINNIASILDCEYSLKEV